jgi:drug/metabolite transporter (DMT)-like permease
MLEALFAAVLWGSTDALAGRSARRSSPILAAIWLHLASLIVLFPFIIVDQAWLAVLPRDAAFGMLAGVAAAAGDVLFGKSLAKSSMSVGIPLANVIAAMIPSLLAMAEGEHLTVVATFGVAGALLATGAAALPSNGQMAVAGAGYAVAAGCLFGAMFALLIQVHAGGGVVAAMVVIFLMRIAGTVVLLLGFLRRGGLPVKTLFAGGALSGALSGIASVGANLLFVLAVTGAGGSRAVISVVAIAFSAPAGMLIANLLGRERLQGAQWTSAVCAVTSIALLAVAPGGSL